VRAAYHAATLDAEAQLLRLARELDKTHQGAAASLREGQPRPSPCTVLRLGVPPTLARTLRSTDESFKAWRRCPPDLAPLGSALGVVDPGAKSRALGLGALPRSFAPRGPKRRAPVVAATPLPGGCFAGCFGCQPAASWR